MTNDRRSWLDALLGRSGRTGPAPVEFQPAGTVFDGVAIPIPFAVVPGREALDLVFRLHQEQPERHAFLLGSPDRLAQMFEDFEDMEPGEDDLSLSAGMTVESWRAERAAQTAQLLADHPEWGDLEEGPERGPWPKKADVQGGFTSVRDLLSGKFLDSVVVGFSPAPVARWWETAAHLRFGGWNDCPDPAVHVMLHKLWAERYGARLVTLAFDTVELAIEKPIRTREEALEVASLQYEYCNDVVDQGTETLERLAASLIGAKSWFFWWD